MMSGLKIIFPPSSEPVTAETVLFQLRYDDPDPEIVNQVEGLITAAREWCEGRQNRAYTTQTLELALDGWPSCNKIELLRPPLQSVISLTYGDEVWDPENYVVDDYSFVGGVVSKTSWPPGSLPVANGIKVRYTAGYGTTNEVPQKVKQAIILLAAHWFDNGMCDPPPAVYRLLDQDRVVPV